MRKRVTLHACKHKGLTAICTNRRTLTSRKKKEGGFGKKRGGGGRKSISRQPVSTEKVELIFTTLQPDPSVLGLKKNAAGARGAHRRGGRGSRDIFDGARVGARTKKERNRDTVRRAASLFWVGERKKRSPISWENINTINEMNNPPGPNTGYLCRTDTGEILIMYEKKGRCRKKRKREATNFIPKRTLDGDATQLMPAARIYLVLPLPEEERSGTKWNTEQDFFKKRGGSGIA